MSYDGINLGQLDGDLDDQWLCLSRGPRIGDDGTPRCKRPRGHRGDHVPAPEDGWPASMSWTDIAVGVQGQGPTTP